MTGAAGEGASKRSEARRAGLATRTSIAISVSEDARWFAPFLREVLPLSLSAELSWDAAPGSHTDLLVETPLRALDYGQLVRDDCLRVLISGEPFSVAEFGDHDLVMDTKDEPDWRPPGVPFVYVPFYVTSFFERRLNRPDDLLTPTDAASPRDRFAAFMYQECLPHRELVFDELARRGPVAALGKCRYDVGDDGVCRERATSRSLYTEERTYLDEAVERYQGFRFVVAVENATAIGYITEKIVNAMLAGAVPVYWGAPDIGEHFDRRSFVNIGAFRDVEEAVDEIARIDADGERYRAMAARPWLRGNRLNEYLDLSAIVADLRQLLAPARPWRPWPSRRT